MKESIKMNDLETNGKKNVAIVVLSYNNVADSLECLASLEQLCGGPYYSYLVDNHSTDDTITRVHAEFPRVEIIPLSQNLGVPSGYNAGIIAAYQAGYEYILVLNNDIVCDAEMLTELLAVATKDPQCAMVMPRIYYYPPRDNRELSRADIWSDGGYSRRFPPTIKMKDDRAGTDHAVARIIEYAPGCAMLIHRRTLERVGLFDEGYFAFYEDWDFCKRIHAAGLNIWVAPDAILWHKVSKSTKKDLRFFWYHTGRSSVRFYRRYCTPTQASLHNFYFILREFFLKIGNLKHLRDFQKGRYSSKDEVLEELLDITTVLAKKNLA